MQKVVIAVVVVVVIVGDNGRNDVNRDEENGRGILGERGMGRGD